MGSNISVLPKKLATNQKRLFDWIRKNAYTERSEGKFYAIRIHQVHGKTRVGDEVERIEVPEPPERGDSWDLDLSTEIMNVLNMEASTLGGMQHYACYSLFSEVEHTVNRCVVAIQAAEEGNEDELISEAPNATGLTAQSMRHQEANARIMSGSILQVVAAQGRQNDKLMEMNQRLMDTQMGMVKDMTEMWEERRRMILDTQTEAVKAHGMEEGISFLKKIGPVLVNQMIGKELLPVDKSAGVTSVARSFYGSLNEEQLAALGQVLRQDQLIQFMTMGETLVSDEDITAEDKDNGKDK